MFKAIPSLIIELIRYTVVISQDTIVCYPPSQEFCGITVNEKYSVF